MKCYIDGKEYTFQNDLKVIYEHQYITEENGAEVFGDLHLTLTSEGVITDVWVDDDCIATNSQLAEDILGELVD